MLVEATDNHFRALVAGVPPTGLDLPFGGLEPTAVLKMLRELAIEVRSEIDPAAWMIVVGGVIVGMCSITKAFPREGVVEIGYGIAAAHRQKGLATAAIGEVLAWARTIPAISAVAADTSIDNVASQRVLEKNGFRRFGDRIDVEDGPLVCWQAMTG